MLEITCENIGTQDGYRFLILFSLIFCRMSKGILGCYHTYVEVGLLPNEVYSTRISSIKCVLIKGYLSYSYNTRDTFI